MLRLRQDNAGTELARTLDGLHFPLDQYYRDLGHLAFAERVRPNFDDLSLIESPLLAGHLAALARGESIKAQNVFMGGFAAPLDFAQGRLKPVVGGWASLSVRRAPALFHCPLWIPRFI